MCFSANASFGAAILLAIIGVLTLKQVKTKTQILFALTPILFAIQQFSEGLLWLNILPKFSTYSFLIFAFLIWPIWIPLSLYYVEKHNKKLIFACLIFGITWSTVLAYYLFNYGATAHLLCQHVYYNIKVPFARSEWLGALLYFVPTALPFFISTQKYMSLFGLALLASAVIATIFWYHFYTSVWCFFAAIISLFIYKIVKYQN